MVKVVTHDQNIPRKYPEMYMIICILHIFVYLCVPLKGIISIAALPANQIPAVVVDIQVTGSANIVMFLPYYEGSVPMQLINDTDFTVAFNQESRPVV